MTRLGAFAIALMFCAAPIAAQDISLTVPLDCDLDGECFIQQYVDHDTSGGVMDFHCSSLSYDTHKGTDFALRSIEHMRRGVNVTAAAPGVVKATRDGMRDRLFRTNQANDLSGRECGNGVLIEHANGWSTQYCHLKRGSVAVRNGDQVSTRTVLGQVGLSGRTQFPHVHLTVRKDGDVVDPFDPDGRIQCGSPSRTTLWQDPPRYQPGGILTVGFADHVPEFADVKEGTATTPHLAADAPALVVVGYAFGSRAGDIMRMRIDGPEGEVIHQQYTLEKTQAQLFRALGKRRTTAEWAKGTYTGVVTLLRNNREISRRQGVTVVK